MKQLSIFLTKASATNIIAYIWVLSSILMFFGIGNVSDQALEKIYSIDMVILGYFFTKNTGKKDDNNTVSSNNPCTDC